MEAEEVSEAAIKKLCEVRSAFGFLRVHHPLGCLRALCLVPRSLFLWGAGTWAQEDILGAARFFRGGRAPRYALRPFRQFRILFPNRKVGDRGGGGALWNEWEDGRGTRTILIRRAIQVFEYLPIRDQNCFILTR